MKNTNTLSPVRPASQKVISSPLNYTGGKAKLLPQVSPYFPDLTYRTFVDAFGGGANVVANIPARRSVYNEYDFAVAKLVEWMRDTPSEEALAQVDAVTARYGLSPANEDGFYACRDDYNRMPDRPPAYLLALLSHANSNRIRWNGSGGYNVSHADDRTFNDAQRKRYPVFADLLRARDLTVVSGSYLDLEIPDDAFVYCDPPYLLSTACYNAGWKEPQERQLLAWLDDLNRRGIPWALSNVTHHHGKTNALLVEFARRYNVYDLTFDYRNASANKKAANRAAVTREVLASPTTTRSD